MIMSVTPFTNRGMQLACQSCSVIRTVLKLPHGRPGHIAIVRPCDKSTAAIMSEGPQIIQAGMTNYESTGLATGFSRHPAAWREQGVRFYYHEVFRN
jgi:hypothetical protein